jgi:hypothetical protein
MLAIQWTVAANTRGTHPELMLSHVKINEPIYAPMKIQIMKYPL